MMAKFGFMHKIFYNKVMSIMSILNKIQQQSNTEASQSQERDAFSLSKQEIEFLLTLIKDSSFKGEYIETLYALVYKLQQQHLTQ
jgi:hypothetical protein